MSGVNAVPKFNDLCKTFFEHKRKLNLFRGKMKRFYAE